MNNDKFLDMLNILSLIVGVQNLNENREQSKHNDIQIENNRQAEYMLTELSKQFEKQNIMLKEILTILRRMYDGQ